MFSMNLIHLHISQDFIINLAKSSRKPFSNIIITFKLLYVHFRLLSFYQKWIDKYIVHIILEKIYTLSELIDNDSFEAFKYSLLLCKLGRYSYPAVLPIYFRTN